MEEKQELEPGLVGRRFPLLPAGEKMSGGQMRGRMMSRSVRISLD
jgi:hypothetical protein